MWLLEKKAFQDLEQARVLGRIPTPEQEQLFLESVATVDSELPRIMSVIGNAAGISIVGILTDAPNWMARYYGGGNTTYSEIRGAIALAESDPKIHEIILNVNSPGGQASSEWIETIDAVNNATKPVRVTVGNMAASAAYGIASQANSIDAQNRFSQIGSVGVVSTHYVDESIVQVTSTSAPKKRPDVTTEEGKAVVRELIDQMEAVFIATISRGRGKGEKEIKRNFGNGALVLADEAIERGMIDSISEQTTQTVTAGATANQTQESIMDLQKLKADHPALYQSVIEDGKKEGVSQERDRVSAHLVLGKASGDMETAMTAIEDGSKMTATIQAKYLAAGMNKNDKKDRKDDGKDADDALDNADDSDDNSDATDLKVAEGVAVLMGAE